MVTRDPHDTITDRKQHMRLRGITRTNAFTYIFEHGTPNPRRSDSDLKKKRRAKNKASRRARRANR